jgi:tripartite-type tricarboxylate transporter receptor subunit TctC
MRGHVMRNCRAQYCRAQNYWAIVPAALLAAFLALSATAQTPGAFAGKTVTMYIGFGPGGGYDLWARVVARHIGAHLPGHPTVTPENFQGAGSYRAANFIYNVAPKDGTAMAAIARDAVLGPLTGAPGAQFDATKFSWLGTPAIETNICIAYHTADVKTFDDLTKKQLVVGDNGPGTGTHSYPLPFVIDLAQRPEDKQAIEFLYAGQGIGRPYIAPPGLPADRLKMVQDAFAATMTDPDFIAETSKYHLALDPSDGAQLEALVKKTYATPKPIVDRIAKLIQ